MKIDVFNITRVPLSLNRVDSKNVLGIKLFMTDILKSVNNNQYSLANFFNAMKGVLINKTFSPSGV